MKYIVCNQKTGDVANIIQTLLEDCPVLMPIVNPFLDNIEVNWEEAKTDDENKANRALRIFLREYRFDWAVREVVR